MVFRYPEDGTTNYIKRVVGLPGDHIRYRNKQLFINDEPVPPRDFVARLPPPWNAGGNSWVRLNMICT